jgi:hypothetical protein
MGAPDVMNKPLRAPLAGASSPATRSGRVDAPGDSPERVLLQRAREQAEAEAAVGDVMRREDEKAAQRAMLERPRRSAPPLKLLLLMTLLLFNGYVWFGHPAWLNFREPELSAPSYYASSWKIAVFLQRQRIEEYRRVKGHIPAFAQQAGQPVTGVLYTPLEQKDYLLAAGSGEKQVVYRSTDSLSVFVGRTLLQMGLVAGGLR